MTIKWFDSITVNDITFRKGDNEEQLFYDTEADGTRYTVIRPHIRNPVMPGMTPPKDGFCHTPYWSAYAERDEAIKLLNSAEVTIRQLGQWHLDNEGPLHAVTDSGYVDPPIKLLTGITKMIADGIDPWAPVVKERQP
jgi:hypothetical protein